MPEEGNVRADDEHYQCEDIQHRDSSSVHLTSLAAWLRRIPEDGAVEVY